VPSVDDLVLGVVTAKLAESWKIDIGCHEHATLSMYSFEGATKKNRADLPVQS
jgi:exosome complex component RRP40